MNFYANLCYWEYNKKRRISIENWLKTFIYQLIIESSIFWKLINFIFLSIRFRNITEISSGYCPKPYLHKRNNNGGNKICHT